ncbi:hypothetical protein CDAR_427601 [Caerostris darwini]|uniref:Uncharacterized protein n=1 Tax=Caerostris darwini TaxID=1538125 RepID=A0AAV4WYW2_9ARAC|nr:hypothetical protein CDAR_427601 [Caerostris darwini]
MSKQAGHLDEKSVIKITIHSSELKPKKLLVQPVVCMHVVDSIHGCYVKKQDRKKAAASFYENQRDDIDYIMPVMSQPCTIKEKISNLLNWEESFILNENLNHLLKKEINTVLFFERKLFALSEYITLQPPLLDKKRRSANMKLFTDMSDTTSMCTAHVTAQVNRQCILSYNFDLLL